MPLYESIQGSRVVSALGDDNLGASHLGQFTQTAWESNAKLGKVLGTYGNED